MDDDEEDGEQGVASTELRGKHLTAKDEKKGREGAKKRTS
jgi:hypothetical protein